MPKPQHDKAIDILDAAAKRKGGLLSAGYVRHLPLPHLQPDRYRTYSNRQQYNLEGSIATLRAAEAKQCSSSPGP